MKLTKILLPVLSVFLLASCSDDDGKSQEIDKATLQDASITIAVSSGDKQVTRSETEAGNNAEKDLNNFAVIYAIGDEVVGYGYRTKNDYVDSTACVGLKAAADGTKYKMLVIANAGDGLIKKNGEVVTFSEKAPSFSWAYYQDLIVNLETQTNAKSFVMTNLSQEITVVPGFNYIGNGYWENKGGHVVKEYEEFVNDNAKSYVFVQRVAARVELYTLKIDWKDEDLKNIEGLRFCLDSIFMANVRENSYITADDDVLENEAAGYLYGNGKNSIKGTDIVASSEYAEWLGKKLRYGSEGLPFIIENGETEEIYGKYTSTDGSKDASRENGFYVMANSASDPVTTLYLKGDLLDGNGNTVLADRYYRIKLTNEIERNKIYRIEATITGKGSPQPGDNKDNLDIVVKITLNDWIVENLGDIEVDPTPVNK